MAADDGRLARVQATLRRHDLAGVVAIDQDNVYYTSGYLRPLRSTSMTLTTESGEQAMIVSNFEESVARWQSWIADLRIYPTWIEVHEVEAVRSGAVTSIEKPVQFGKDTAYRLLVELLQERGLGGQRVGIEINSLSQADAEQLISLTPDIDWVDSKPVMYQARAVKTPSEITALRIATELDEIGHQAAVAEPRGRTLEQMALAYRLAVYAAALERGDAHGTLDVRTYISAGERIGPNMLGDDRPVRDGDVIFIDSSVLVEGYGSDIGRSYAVGDVDPLATTIHQILLEGYQAGLELLRPGVPMRDVYDVINRTIKPKLPAYTRGHFGHVPGIGFGEQPPFFAPNETAILEENIVLNIETPYYIKGLGGLQIEDMLLITSDGYRSFNRLPLAMTRV